MLVLVTYDVNTESSNGKKRLRHVAKKCVDYGQRVQNSVFECSVMPDQYVKLKNDLKNIIDLERDSLRFYLLGKNWENRVETLGKDESYNPDKDVFIL
ncbi:CRISPR-associated endonuclease Cas2 [Corticicoccus populi]|uniref:CRISPR-associated endoribonuclease Cas2 n=1 Tax=Corticicoccus populi TaxID=1812821 RepID=A0ABW5WVT1_9STAP